MSVSSAMDTAVSGLTAQSVAFSNVSNNISNSQTIGYKATDTSFSDYVEASGALEGQSGTVIASTQYSNQSSGPITASTANGALAINGNGFFAVNEVSGQSTSAMPSFSATQYYTRAGDFSSDKNGYLVNSAGEYLDGYMASPGTGALATTISPINVNGIAYRPIATSTIAISSTVPGASILAAGATGLPQVSSETVYDKTGTAQTVGLTWTQIAGATAATTAPAAAATSGTYTLAVSGTSTASSATVTFNANGTLQSVVPVAPATSTGPSSFDIGAVGGDTSNISLSLGTIGSSSSGTVMDSTTGAAFSAGTASQDGTSAATQTGFKMGTDGSVTATFDNGQTQLIGKVPLATFGNANALQAQDGQAYTATAESGAASMQLAATSGAGRLETRSVEGSNTSLDTDLTKLIVAQQAYGASAKVVTTANELLQMALAMKQ